MKIAVIGSGGREHAIVYALSKSKQVESIYAIPGNDAMKALATCVPVENNNLDEMVNICQEKKVDLVVIGPEGPLTQGITDCLQAVGIPVFGPNKKAAQLEGSKAFAKALMKKYGIPTAAYEVFTDLESAKKYILKQGAPIVIKADGLAAGKGVVVAQTTTEAIQAVSRMLAEKEFGAAGVKVVIEECMEGEEVSVLSFVDGTQVVPLISAQDHKRIFDHDKGPNTGGMGAYAPAPILTVDLMKLVKERILYPTLQALHQEEITYRGCLYAGLMITKEGPKVVEFNCRFGDPETQAILPLLTGDLAQIMYDCAVGTVDAKQVTWQKGAACCVMMASSGYPATSHKGDVIHGLNEIHDVLVFHSGTKKKEQTFVTNGGRVIGVTATGMDLKEAVIKAYQAVDKINFAGMQYRKDIAYKGLQHLTKKDLF